jgi:hypothetical protein
VFGGNGDDDYKGSGAAGKEGRNVWKGGRSIIKLRRCD